VNFGNDGKRGSLNSFLRTVNFVHAFLKPQSAAAGSPDFAKTWTIIGG
jgi:hypothetical protein